MTNAARLKRIRWASIEPILCVSLVLLKLGVLYRQWSKVDGYDWGGWLPVLHWTRWFEPLPSTRSVGISYHPSLSYLIGRTIYSIYPHEVETSQILSTASILAAFFALRALLKRVGWLHTVPGLWLLYGGMSLPLFVWLAIETCYDGLVLTWFMLALASSVALFWTPSSPRWWNNLKFSTRLTGLGIVFACAMMTKVNGLVAFGVPFLIIFVRRGIPGLRREFVAPLVAAAIGVVIVSPYYYHHFYQTEGKVMPISIDWERPNELAHERMKRDRAPVEFFLHMIRIPAQDSANPQKPELDSFISLVWTQTWKRDIWLGKQPEPSLSVSNTYAKLFTWTLLAGTLYFFVRRRHIPRDWLHVGWVLLGISVVFSCAALSFAWQYPMFDWRVFKAKYMSPALFWILYATAIMLADSWVLTSKSRWVRWLENASLLFLLSFVFVNHLLPVY